MGFWNKYPYTDFHELNLDWILKRITSLTETMDTFTALNAIVWGGNWDITQAYKKWTVVQDETGNGYISIQAVPAGVTLDNDDYWVKVAGYDTIYNEFNSRITQNATNISSNAADIETVRKAAAAANSNATTANNTANSAINSVATLSNLVNCYIPDMQRKEHHMIQIPSNINGYGMQGGCYNPTRGVYCAYFTNSAQTDGYIVEFNLTTYTISNTLGTFAYGSGNDMSFDGTNILLVTGETGSYANQLLILDPSNYTRKTSVALPSAGWGVAYDNNTDRIIATNYDSAWIFNKSYTLQSTITIGFTTPDEAPTVQGCFIYNNGLYAMWTGLNGILQLNEYNLSNLSGGEINNTKYHTTFYVTEPENGDSYNNKIYIFSREGTYWISINTLDTAKQTDNSDILTGGKILANNTDWNTLVTPEKYCIASTSSFNSMSNTPPFCSTGGTLIVFANAYLRVTQIYIPQEQWTDFSYYSPCYYIRCCNIEQQRDYNSVWTHWRGCSGHEYESTTNILTPFFIDMTRYNMYISTPGEIQFALYNANNIELTAYAGSHYINETIKENGNWDTAEYTMDFTHGANQVTLYSTSGMMFSFDVYAGNINFTIS